MIMETKKYPLIDTRVHIDELADIEGAIGWAQSTGIKAIIALGSDLVSNERVLKIARTLPGYGAGYWWEWAFRIAGT